MEKLIEKLALYDILARLVTGVIVLFAAEFFGILDLLGISVNLSELGTATLLVTGYFCGIILETVSMLLPKCRAKFEEDVLKEKKIGVEQYEKWKKQLLKDNQQIVMDEPMAHIVMSLSFAIAFTFFLVVKVVSSICPISKLCTEAVSIIVMAFLVGLFCYRAVSYTKRRVKQICDYCTTKTAKTEKQNENSAGTEK